MKRIFLLLIAVPLLLGAAASTVKLPLPSATTRAPRMSTKQVKSRPVKSRLLTTEERLQRQYRLKPSDLPKPLEQGWDNRVVGKYIPGALTANGMPVPRSTTVLGKTLSMQEAILLSLRNNPGVLTAEMQRVEDKYGVQSTLNSLRYDLGNLSINVEGNWAQGTGVTSTSNYGPNITFHNKLGTTLSVGYSGSNASFALSQDLLNGYDTPRLDYLDLLDKLRQNRFTYETSIVGTVTTTIAAYLKVVGDKMSLQTALQSYNNQKEELEQNRIKLKVGQLSRSNFRGQQSAMAQAAVSLNAAKLNLSNDTISLLQAIGLAPETKVVVPSKLNFNTLPMKIPPIEQAVAKMLRRNIVYQTELITVRQDQRTIVLGRDSMKWTLTASYTHNQNLGGPATSALTPTFGIPATPINNGDMASLSLMVPLYTLQARSALVGDRISYEEAKITLRQDKENDVRAIINDYHTISSDKVQLQLTKKSVDLQKLVLRDTQVQYSLGRQTYFQLEQVRQTLVLSENSLILARIGYFTSIQQLYTNIGNTLDVWHIKLRY